MEVEKDKESNHLTPFIENHKEQSNELARQAIPERKISKRREVQEERGMVL